jgi:hypothetical protein
MLIFTHRREGKMKLTVLAAAAAIIALTASAFTRSNTSANL